MKIAIIDYDGTLFKKETIPFLMGLAKKSSIRKYDYYITMTKVLFQLFRYKIGIQKSYDKERFNREAAKAYLGMFRNLEPEEIDKFFKDSAAKAEEFFNYEVLKEYKRLKEEGYITVLLSGGFLPYISIIGNKLGFDHVIGTELCYGKKGVDFNKDIVFITGKNKLKMILDRFPENVDWQNSYSFADSYFDSEILELAGNSIAVNPDPKLREYANQKGWRIIEK